MVATSCTRGRSAIGPVCTSRPSRSTDTVQLLVDGKYNGVIESNPRFGPLAFKALADFESDTAVPAKIIISDNEYTPDNAAASLSKAF